MCGPILSLTSQPNTRAIQPVNYFHSCVERNIIRSRCCVLTPFNSSGSWLGHLYGKRNRRQRIAAHAISRKKCENKYDNCYDLFDYSWYAVGIPQTSRSLENWYPVGEDIINAATISIFGQQRRKHDGFTFAQAFWFTLASTVVSSLTNITLLIDFIRTKDFAISGSGLSHKQRSLVIIVILLLSWVAIGSGCFTALLDIGFQDSLYFTIVSMESECPYYLIFNLKWALNTCYSYWIWRYQSWK